MLINQLDETIGSFKARVDVKVNNVHASTTSIQATTDRIYENIVKFKTDMLHGEEKQIAHENILRIDQIIKEHFQGYAAIRRTVQGIVRDFDINLVRNSTIQELSEELWITSSRYWLSYAMIAITAWVNNYQDIAKNALAESGRKDAIKTTLFFCLMNLRFHRLYPAKLWFEEYFRTLDPAKLQHETAVMLQAFLNGIFGKDKELEQRIIDLIHDWIVIISEDEKISAELIGEYEAYVQNMRSPTQCNYEALKQYCVNYAEIQKVYNEVSKFDSLIEFVRAFDVEAVIQDDENYKDRVDAVLFSLMSIPDVEEQELKNQQEYYRFIIANEGVKEKAQEQFDRMIAHQTENFNIGKHMQKWVIYDDSARTDIQVRKFGFQNTKDWFKSAVNNWSAKLNAAFPQEYRLHIDIWDGISNGQDEAQQAQSLQNFYENNKFQYMFVNAPNIAAAILVLLSLGLVFVTPFSLVVTVLAAGFLGWRVLTALKEYPARMQAALANLSACMAEVADFKRYYEENQAKKGELLGIIEFI